MEWISKREWMPVVIVSVCVVLLTIMVAQSPRGFRYDEPFHFRLTQSVKVMGWQEALISRENGSATGPLFPALQLALEPVTGLRVPAVRWVNWVCLFAFISLVGLQLGLDSVKRTGLSAVSLISVPYLWPVTGLALTEIPALVAFTGFTYSFHRLLRLPDFITKESCAWAGFAGLCLGVSILGRQTYLVAAPVIGGMLFWMPRKWPLLLGTILVCFLTCGWLFVLWGALLPPAYQNSVPGISLEHGILSLGGAAGATLFLNPRWMKPPNRLALIVCVVFGIVLNVYSRKYVNPPAKALLNTVFDVDTARFIGFIGGCVLVILGMLWMWNSLVNAWIARRDRCQMFAFLTLFALVITPVTVTHQFSTRYLVGSLGILVVVIGAPRTFGAWWMLRMMAGSFVGAAILWTYYNGG
jgi:hypothetical protein